MPFRWGFLALLSTVTVLAGCGSGAPRFTSAGRADASFRDLSMHQLEGIASYYGNEFQGRRTANGEVYDMNEMTAAHRSLPFGTKVRVTHRETGKWVVVRINDRGPFKDDRVIDLSLSAANQIGLITNGTGPVVLEVVELAPQTR